jgi:cupin fold WbuC family metalloprotein
LGPDGTGARQSSQETRPVGPLRHHLRTLFPTALGWRRVAARGTVSRGRGGSAGERGRGNVSVVVPNVSVIDPALLERTLAAARSSPRLRAVHTFHRDAADNPHRFLNAFVRGTYLPPHRHLAIPKSKSFLVLRGELACFVFDDKGLVKERYILGRAGVAGIDIQPAVWHTLAPIGESAICFEVKPGPWDAATDRELAPWAPREGDAHAPAYMAALMAEL